mgnify:CR=1 FL=1
MAKTVSPLLERLRKVSALDYTETMTDSKIFDVDHVPTQIPILNVALSGSTERGLSNGSLVIAGPSKHFKSLTGLVLVDSYLKKYPEGVCLFYDSEFGAPKKYFKSIGIDTERVLHCPVKNIEELKFDLMKKLQDIKRGERIVIFIDSLGNIASKKEVEDAINEKSVADMTRAKALKSLFRMITPELVLKDIPLVAISHTYSDQGMYPKEIVSGGRGVTYGANAVWIVGRQQEKDDTGIKGYNFVYNVEKSRFVKEKSKLTLTVTWDGGINKFSGLLDIAMEGGYVIKPSAGWYVGCDPKTKKDLTKKVREDETSTDAFWQTIFDKTDFKDYVTKRFSVGETQMLTSASEAGPEDESD